jgi:hypothetical protein
MLQGAHGRSERVSANQHRALGGSPKTRDEAECCSGVMQH